MVMLKMPTLWTAFCTVVAVGASELQSLQPLEIDSAPSSNQSCHFSGESMEATIKVRCDGQQYGQGLNIEKCKEAFQTISRCSKQISFGERRTAEDYDVKIPVRFSSGM